MTAEPAKLPLVREDPSIVKGYEVKARYAAELAAAKNGYGKTDVDKARGVNKAWKTMNAELTALYQDMQTRRQARVDHLRAKLPIGPGIPEGTSPADRAVLMAAWSNALKAVRESKAAYGENEIDRGWPRMLTEATKYGDETMQRALFTAAAEDSHPKFLKQWAAQVAPEIGEAFQEWQEESQRLEGRHFDNQWVGQALGLPEQPQESKHLASIVNHANQQIQRNNAHQGVSSPNRQPLIELEPGEL